MVAINLESLAKFFQKKGLEAQIQKETQQIFFILKHEKREFPVFIKIYPSKLVQFLAFLPCQVKNEQIDPLARLLHIINRETEYPGFGMDEKARYAFFRCMVHPHKDEIPEATLENSVAITFEACKNYSPAIEAVAMGLMKIDDIIKAEKK